jgi:hypothetical protein
MRKLLLALMGVVLVGCSSPSTPAPESRSTTKTSATPTSTPTPTPTPTVWTKPDAGAAYLGMVAPVNANLARLKAAVGANDLGKITAACKEQARLEDAFARDLDAGSWSKDVRPLVDDLIASVASQRSLFISCATAKSLSDLETPRPNADPHPGAGQVLRVRLGLPATS